jgi:hypothetical protein
MDNEDSLFNNDTASGSDIEEQNHPAGISQILPATEGNNAAADGGGAQPPLVDADEAATGGATAAAAADNAATAIGAENAPYPAAVAAGEDAHVVEETLAPGIAQGTPFMGMCYSLSSTAIRQADMKISLD